MHDQDIILTKLRDSKDDLFAKYPISNLALFGSFARGDYHDGSDVDILVEFNGSIGMGFFKVAGDLEKLLGKKVDLVSQKGIRSDYFSQIKNDLIYV